MQQLLADEQPLSPGTTRMLERETRLLHSLFKR